MTETDFENNLYWNMHYVEGKEEEHHEFSNYETCRAIDERRRMEQRRMERERKEMQEAEEKREKERKNMRLEMIRALKEAFNALKQCVQSSTINYDMVGRKGRELSLFAQYYFVQLLRKAEELIKSREERIRRIEREIVELFTQQYDVKNYFDF